MLIKDEQDASAEDFRPRLNAGGEGGAVSCTPAGVWTTRTVALVDREVRDVEEDQDARSLSIDLSRITNLDTAGAWLIRRLIASFAGRGVATEVTGMSASAETLLGAVESAATREKLPSPTRHRFGPLTILEIVGRNAYAFRDDFFMGMNILGATIRGAQMKLGRGHAVNPAAIVTQIDRMGVGAVPVVVLMAFIIGAIVAQQGAFQLRFFGAEIFVVDLVGILVLREIGVLLTAIMIAGRSGSAITAEIGSMKMREEVDALTVIGLNPMGVLVFPRLVALVIALPCLTIAADFAAIGGAIAVSWIYSDITPAAFIVRMREAIDLSTVMAGLIKAPFMALIIGVIASIEGMKVGGSAESLGLHVTASVVKAIFVVIVVDGMFAMFYAAIDF